MPQQFSQNVMNLACNGNCLHNLRTYCNLQIHVKQIVQLELVSKWQDRSSGGHFKATFISLKQRCYCIYHHVQHSKVVDLTTQCTGMNVLRINFRNYSPKQHPTVCLHNGNAWFPVWQEICFTHNLTPHSLIGMTPQRLINMMPYGMINMTPCSLICMTP